MKKIVRLTESDLTRLVKRVISEGNKNDKLIIKYLNNEYGDSEKYTTKKYPNSVYLVKDNKIYIELDTKYNSLYVDFDTIWGVIDFFGLEYPEFERILKKWLEETYNMKGVSYIEIDGHLDILRGWSDIMDKKQNDPLILRYLNTEYGDLKEYTTDKYPDRIFYVKDGKVYMELDTKSNILYLDYDIIWGVIDVFGVEDFEFEHIIDKWLEETYNIKGVSNIEIDNEHNFFRGWDKLMN